MFVIGCAGQMYAAKDTLADHLAQRLNESGCVKWQRVAFAANVKKVFADTFDVSLEFIEKWKSIPEKPPGFDLPVRQSLQLIGDGFRKMKSTIWLDLVFRDKNIPKIISDVRYINEFRRVKKEGGLNILIVRPDKLNDDPNGSEAQIKPYVEWALAHLKDCESVQKQLDHLAALEAMGGGAQVAVPEHMECFDVFVRNDGTKQELLDKIDNLLVPFVSNFISGRCPEVQRPRVKRKSRRKACRRKVKDIGRHKLLDAEMDLFLSLDYT